MEVRLSEDMVLFPLKLGKDKCMVITLHIDFLFDRWVTCNNKMLYHQEISRDLQQ